VLTFQDRYNTTVEPFDWKYTRNNLNDDLKRLSKRQPAPAA